MNPLSNNSSLGGRGGSIVTTDDPIFIHSTGINDYTDI